MPVLHMLRLRLAALCHCPPGSPNSVYDFNSTLDFSDYQASTNNTAIKHTARLISKETD